jgi:ribosomal protein L37AE/L43A
MGRLDVRCNVELPVSVIIENTVDKGVSETKSKFTSLSLGGGVIDYSHPNDFSRIVGLKYDLPRHGEFEILGEVLRCHGNGIATRFYNLNRDAKIKLWDFLKESITDDPSCPYCGKQHSQKLTKCNKCGWNLNFHSSDYITEHEKESFINRFALKSKEFSIEDMYKVLNFVDVDILKIGKNLDINEEFVGSSNRERIDGQGYS